MENEPPRYTKGTSGGKGAEDAEALVNTVANRLANVNGEKLLARLSDLRAKTLVTGWLTK